MKKCKEEIEALQTWMNYLIFKKRTVESLGCQNKTNDCINNFFVS